MSLKAPLTVQFELTERCNHRCPYCYNTKDKNKSESNEIVIAVAKKLVEIGIFNVVLTGGEPLLKKAIFNELLAIFTDNKIMVNINTNLTLLDQECLCCLERFKVNGLVVSCQGTDDVIYKKLTGGGDLNRFYEKLDLLLKSKLHFIVNMVVTNVNKHLIVSTAEKLKSLGVKKFAATPMSLNICIPDFENLLSQQDVIDVLNSLLWIKKNLGLSIDILEPIPKCIFPKEHIPELWELFLRQCQVGKTTLVVQPDGQVRNCIHSDANIGNILNDNFDDLWQKASLWTPQENIPKECLSCYFSVSCCGGCRLMAQSNFGDLSARHPWSGDPVEYFKMPRKVFPDLTLSTNFKVIGIVKWRKEGNSYLVNPGIIANMMRVNEELFEFMQKLTDFDVISMSEIINIFDGDLNNEAFVNVIKLLLGKGFLATK